MAATITHTYVATGIDAGNGEVHKSEWNAAHTLTGTIDVANGGTGVGTITGLVKGNGTSAFTAATAGTDYLVFSEITDTPSTNQNNYAPTGIASATSIMLNIGASIEITGISAGSSGQTITLTNSSTDYLLWLEHQSASSTAANRFILPKGFPAFLMPGDTITLRYDTTASRWRVVHWPNQGPIMGLVYFNDFTNPNAPAATAYPVGEFNFALSGTGSGASGTAYLADGTEKPVGMINLQAGTTTTGRSHIYTGTNLVWGQGPALFVSRVAVQQAATGTDTFVVRTGYTDGPGTGTPVNGCGWEYRWNGAAVEWSQTSWNAGTPTRSTTGSPTPDLTYIWLICFQNAAGTRVDMIYSQDSATCAEASSVSTGLPAAGTAIGIEALTISKSAGTVARLASIDFAGFRFDGVRG